MRGRGRRRAGDRPPPARRRRDAGRARAGSNVSDHSPGGRAGHRPDGRPARAACPATGADARTGSSAATPARLRRRAAPLDRSRAPKRRRKRGVVRRFFTFLLLVVLLAGAGAAAYVALSPGESSVRLRDVVHDSADEVITDLKQLIKDNTK